MKRITLSSLIKKLCTYLVVGDRDLFHDDDVMRKYVEHAYGSIGEYHFVHLMWMFVTARYKFNADFTNLCFGLWQLLRTAHLT